MKYSGRVDLMCEHVLAEVIVLDCHATKVHGYTILL